MKPLSKSVCVLGERTTVVVFNYWYTWRPSVFYVILPVVLTIGEVLPHSPPPHNLIDLPSHKKTEGCILLYFGSSSQPRSGYLYSLSRNPYPPYTGTKETRTVTPGRGSSQNGFSSPVSLTDPLMFHRGTEWSSLPGPQESLTWMLDQIPTPLFWNTIGVVNDVFTNYSWTMLGSWQDYDFYVIPCSINSGDASSSNERSAVIRVGYGEEYGRTSIM